MQRTQIQLTEEQVSRIKELASEMGVSSAEVVRQCVDESLDASTGISRQERRQRAAAVVGRFASGQQDVSEHHDHYLGDAFQ
jgi:predicted DNA-binding protein